MSITPEGKKLIDGMVDGVVKSGYNDGWRAAVEHCAKVADQVAINAERRAAGHDNEEAKRAAIDKMEGAQAVAAAIRETKR